MQALYSFLLLLALTCLSQQSFSATIDTLTIESPSMHKSIKAGIVIPQSYTKSKTNYPVLYLMHGFSGTFRSWLTKTTDKQQLRKLADQYNIIIVTPDGGYASWYMDSPINQESQFETFFTKELITKIDGSYRTIRNRNGRVISGLSMGGHGALYLATHHPELYCAATSMSGAVDISDIVSKDTEPHFSAILGSREANAALYQEHSVVFMVDKMRNNNVKMLIECGTEDFLIDSNRELHRRLLYGKIPHEYLERPGAHTWPYWSESLPYHMLFFQRTFQENGTFSTASVK
ncbi:alpha/beta hydrolase [Adhaeribacter aquaticus]|uniref:alpha/beta hydrolase n=1 Tax=Adhaeribacter aquaticus TaxID=299567 RepID=UPI00041095AF|nr:alpha/beta hydrolase family protein [Adhaeribacter aquaticus]